MGISKYRSTVTMSGAGEPYPSILQFLCRRFPGVSQDDWEQRIANGKVLDDGARPITPDTTYAPGKRLFYFRDVSKEPAMPVTEEILFRDDEIMVCCKPHFLPVTPGGRYVDQCLLNRLRRSTGLDDLVPLHRIDRETAGIVMFSVNKKTRGLYANLFKNGHVHKTYHALSASLPHSEQTAWVIQSRIERAEPWFRCKTVPGVANSHSAIHLVELRNNRARFLLQPLTGKTHQLRIHMSDLGFGIMNDKYYPELQPESEDDFSKPLQLVAKRVEFRDPITGEQRQFTSSRDLMG